MNGNDTRFFGSSDTDSDTSLGPVRTRFWSVDPLVGQRFRHGHEHRFDMSSDVDSNTDLDPGKILSSNSDSDTDSDKVMTSNTDTTSSFFNR